MTLTDAEVAVLDDLRERSDEQHDHEYVTNQQFPAALLRTMALKRLVRLSGPGDAVELRAWITNEGVSALLSYERQG